MNKELKPSLGSRPSVHHCFPGLMLTSVTTGKQPKKLGPQVEVNQRGSCVLQWQGGFYANLLSTVHLVDSGLIDDWLLGSSVGSTKDLELCKYIVELCIRQPLTTRD